MSEINVLVENPRSGEQKIQRSMATIEEIITAEKTRREKIRSGQYVKQFVRSILKEDGSVDEISTNKLESETAYEAII